MDKYDILKLEQQLCFPLYAAAKEVVRLYTPILTRLDLTYTQYIAMMLIWEKQTLSVKDLGDGLFLDTGTLTPLVRKLKQKGWVDLHHDRNDRRHVLVSVTPQGNALRDQALNVPEQISARLPINQQEALTLYLLLYKILGTMGQPESGTAADDIDHHIKTK